MTNYNDGASAFNAVNAHHSPTIVETVSANGLNEGQGENDPDDSVRVNLSTKLSDALFDEDASHGSGLGDLLIDAETEDQGKEDFPILVGPLRNGSETPLDGTQNVSFGEDDVEELQVEAIAPGDDPWVDAILFASKNPMWLMEE